VLTRFLTSLTHMLGLHGKKLKVSQCQFCKKTYINYFFYFSIL
jgi:hypothetical protein